jgi:hypothetical protein
VHGKEIYPKRWSRAAMMRAKSRGGTSEGVPPPKNTVRSGRRRESSSSSASPDTIWGYWVLGRGLKVEYTLEFWPLKGKRSMVPDLSFRF